MKGDHFRMHFLALAALALSGCSTPTESNGWAVVGEGSIPIFSTETLLVNNRTLLADAGVVHAEFPSIVPPGSYRLAMAANVAFNASGTVVPIDGSAVNWSCVDASPSFTPSVAVIPTPTESGCEVLIDAPEGTGGLARLNWTAQAASVPWSLQFAVSQRGDGWTSS